MQQYNFNRKLLPLQTWLEPIPSWLWEVKNTKYIVSLEGVEYVLSTEPGPWTASGYTWSTAHPSYKHAQIYPEKWKQE